MLSESCPRMVIVGMAACFRRQAGNSDGMPKYHAKRVYRIMRQNAAVVERKPLYRHRETGAHTGKVAVKAINDGALTGSESAA